MFFEEDTVDYGNGYKDDEDYRIINHKPVTSDRTLLCWNCCHKIEGQPVCIPIEPFEKYSRWIMGSHMCCSVNCAKRTIVSTIKYNTQCMLMWLYKYCSEVLQCESPELCIIAPPREVLSVFGGWMDIKTYRSKFTEATKYLLRPQFTTQFASTIQEVKPIEEANHPKQPSLFEKFIEANDKYAKDADKSETEEQLAESAKPSKPKAEEKPSSEQPTEKKTIGETIAKQKKPASKKSAKTNKRKAKKKPAKKHESQAVSKQAEEQKPEEPHKPAIKKTKSSEKPVKPAKSAKPKRKAVAKKKKEPKQASTQQRNTLFNYIS